MFFFHVTNLVSMSVFHVLRGDNKQTGYLRSTGRKTKREKKLKVRLIMRSLCG